MTARWQITALSTKDEDGNYVTTVAEGQDIEIVFDAEEEFTSVDGDLFRIKHDYELRTATDDPYAAMPAESITVDNVSNVYAAVAITGLERGQTYLLVIRFDDETPEGWSRTRVIDVVA